MLGGAYFSIFTVSGATVNGILHFRAFSHLFSFDFAFSSVSSFPFYFYCTSCHYTLCFQLSLSIIVMNSVTFCLSALSIRMLETIDGCRKENLPVMILEFL
jgi:hypothetical protein